MPSDINWHTPRSETVVGSIDSAPGSDEFVIADISADGAWLSMSADDAAALPSWR